MPSGFLNHNNDPAGIRRAEVVTNLQKQCDTKFRDIIHVVRDDSEVYVESLRTILATDDKNSALEVLRLEPGHAQFETLRLIIQEYHIANSLFGDLLAGASLSTLREILQAMYTRRSSGDQTFSLSVMEVAARILESSYKDVYPPPQYREGAVPSMMQNLVHDLEGGILTEQSAPRQDPRVGEAGWEQRPSALLRRREISGKSSGSHSPTQSQGSPLRSRKQTPGNSGQRTPSTPLSQGFGPSDVETTPSSTRRLPAIPGVFSSGEPTSPSPSSSAGAGLVASTPSGSQLGSTGTTAPEVPPKNSMLESELVEQGIVHGLSHLGPCRYSTEPVVVQHIKYCMFCPTRTGRPGRPCVEEVIDVVVTTTLRPAPYPAGHPSVDKQWVFGLTALVLADLLFNVVLKKFGAA